MFREMRRVKQKLSVQESISVLERNTSGVMAVSGDDGYPYAVPLSYAWTEGRLFFHCAKTGHKLDGIAENDKVSFCVIDQDQIVPEEFTTYFRSVIVFGRARVVTDISEAKAALELIACKYSPNQIAEREKEIERQIDRTGVIELKVEHISGKAARELSKK